MLFTGLRETLSKLVQSPFFVVRAEEEELVDPAKVLRVSSLILRYNGSDINVIWFFRLSANNKKKRKNGLPSSNSVTPG